MTTLTLDRLTIRFARPDHTPLEVVDRLSLTVPAGTMHCLAGRSGSGKTSVLRVAGGLARPAHGSVRWGDHVIDRLRDDDVAALRRTTLGYLDQGGALVEGMTAIENVLLPAVPGHRVRSLRARAEGLLAELGVAGQARQRPNALSGGERQRVALARALLLTPAIVMADEPTASLDRTTADGVIRLLTGLRDRGIAVLVASHDPALITASDTRTELT